jgi:hypothetical protein
MPGFTPLRLYTRFSAEAVPSVELLIYTEAFETGALPEAFKTSPLIETCAFTARN